MTDKRITLRVISRDRTNSLVAVFEQSIPAKSHEIALFCRRDPFRDAVVDSLLAGGTVTIERKP